MKKGFLGVFVSVLLVFILTACQTSASLNSYKVDSSNNVGKNTQDKTEEKNSVTTNEKISSFNVAGESESSFSVGDSQQVNGLTVTLVNVRQIVVDHIKPNKDQFVVIEMRVENKGEKAVHITSLPQINLIANNEKQDMAILSQTKGDLNITIQPGEGITGEIAFDSSKSDVYSLVFKELETEKDIVWNFTHEKIHTNAKK